jgi:hypothetical protein
MRFVNALLLTLPDHLARVVDIMLRGDRHTRYSRVAEELGISALAARQYGWRGSSLLAQAILRGSGTRHVGGKHPPRRPPSLLPTCIPGPQQQQ